MEVASLLVKHKADINAVSKVVTSLTACTIFPKSINSVARLAPVKLNGGGTSACRALPVVPCIAPANYLT